jgi:hypothetical protein
MSKILTPDALTYREHCGKINPIILADRLGTPLHEKQKEISKYFLKEERDQWDYYSVLAGRRFGKSFVMRMIAISELLSPCGKVVIITPTMRLAEKHFQAIVKYLKKFPELDGKVSALKQKTTIEIPFLESSLITASFDSWDDRVTGDALTLTIYDEIFLANPKTQEDMIETIYPTLATYGSYPSGALYGKTFSLGTPRGTRLGSLAGRNHSRALSNLPQDKFVKGVEYTVYDNPLVDEETIEALKNKMSKAKFDREFMVKFEASSTSIFSNFEHDMHVTNVREIESLKNRDDLFLIVAFDFGFGRDPDGNTFIIYDDNNQTYYVVAESSENGRFTKDMFKNSIPIRDKIQKDFNISKGNTLYIADVASPENIAIGRKDFGFNFLKIKKDRKDGFETVNDKLEGRVDGKVCFYIDKSCTELIRQMTFAEYKVVGDKITDNYATDINGTHYDLCDCVRYTVFNIEKYMRKVTIISS